MKNKKFLYAIIALVLIMCLGIGYAAVSKTLTVNGTSSTGDAGIGGGGVDPDPDDPLNDNFVVYFDPGTKNVAVTTEATGLNTDAEVTVSDLTATIEVTDLVELNSYVTVTLKIKNDSADLKASIPVPTITYLDGEGNATEKKYFEVTTDWTATTLEAKNDGGDNDEKVVNIKIELIKSPIKNVEAAFKIVFNASAVETT